MARGAGGQDTLGAVQGGVADLRVVAQDDAEGLELVFEHLCAPAIARLTQAARRACMAHTL